MSQITFRESKGKAYSSISSSPGGRAASQPLLSVFCELRTSIGVKLLGLSRKSFALLRSLSLRSCGLRSSPHQLKKSLLKILSGKKCTLFSKDAQIFHKKKERTCRTHRQPTTTLNQYTGKIYSNAFSTTHSRTQREQGDSNAVGLHQQETQTTLRFNITAGYYTVRSTKMNSSFNPESTEA